MYRPMDWLEIETQAQNSNAMSGALRLVVLEVSVSLN